MKNKGNSGSDEEIIEEEDKCVYDQFLDELKFYSSCPSTAHEPQSDDSLTDVDSGYTTARHSAIPEERTINQPRKTTKIVRCLKYDVKQRQQKLIERRELRRNKPLNLQTIAWHLLDFVSPKLDPDYKLPRAPCIFQVVDDKVYVQKAYQASKGYFEQVSPMFLHMAQSFLQTHRNWSILSDFADTQREVADKPAFVICWLEIYDEFVYTFVREITKLKSNCHDPITALRKGKTVCDVVDFLTSIINPVRAAREWKFENIELAWSLMLAAISEESVLSPEKKNIALKLQCAAFSVFLGAMDMLYYFGEIPSGVKSDFIIYRDSNNPTNFECHPTPAHSVLWSRQLIKTIHRGAVLRQRLGNLFNLDSSSFSAEVRALLPEWETQLIPTHIFRRIFHCIAVDFTDRLGQELFSKIMGAGLLQLWRDMKNITIGASSTLFATAIFNLEVAVSPEKAFQNSLKAGNVSSIAKWRREVSPGHTGELHFEVSGVLTHLIGGSLIKTINAILDSWLKLYRMHFILVAVISDNKLLSDSRATLRRQFCFVTSKVYNVLVIVRNHFYYKINQIFIEVEEQIKVMTTYYDVEKIIKKAEHELMNLIDAKHDITTKNILGVINTFSNLIDDIRLKSLSNDVHGSILHEWRKSLLFTQESIRSLGTTVSPDSTFFSLYKQIQYR